MRYVAAYLLTVLGGKDNPSTADIEKVLSSVGIEADGEKLKKVLSELGGKNIEDIITKGKEKLASIPSGGAPVAAAAPGAGAPAAAGSPAKKEEKKEAKKEEPEESDDDMGFGLFD
ncbi:60S acidic ribosomal protein P2 [Polyplax serrata]|uniref:Large ribosomal subunit protein P2 n=1 Tax=Polyplax serrata TaxID=468196 RepID=A0AAN8P773_POLSC